MRTTALVLATLLVGLGALALAPSASADCEVTEPGCIPDFLREEECIENVPPHGHRLCWGP